MRVPAASMSLVLAAALAGCTADGGDTTATTTSAGAQAVLAANKADHAETGDATYDASKVVEVKLAGASARPGGKLTVDAGGTGLLYGATSRGSGALDLNGSLTLDGGTVVAVGSAVTPSEDSDQGWLSVALDSSPAAGTTLHVVDAGGKVTTTFVTSRAAQILTVSSADLTNGTEYRVYAGGTATGATAGGLAASGSLGSATPIATGTAGEPGAGGMGRPGRGR